MSSIPFRCKICGYLFINKYSHIFFTPPECLLQFLPSSLLLLPSLIPFSITLYVAHLKHSNYSNSSVYDVYHLLPKTIFKCSVNIYFRCPICLDENSINPVIFTCGHCTCKKCYEMLISASSFSSSKKCPICRNENILILITNNYHHQYT